MRVEQKSDKVEVGVLSSSLHSRFFPPSFTIPLLSLEGVLLVAFFWISLDTLSSSPYFIWMLTGRVSLSLNCN